MKITHSLLITVLTACIFAACGNSDKNTIIPDQREAIQRFLETNELAYEEVNGVFRHFGARGNENSPVARQGQQVGIDFELYTASYTKSQYQDPNDEKKLKPDTKTALFSNKQAVQDTLKKYNLNTEYWPTGVYNATLGSSDLITGLNRGLEGCMKGDSVLLFITSNYAFGGEPTTLLPENTAVLYIVNIKTVNNQ